MRTVRLGLDIFLGRGKLKFVRNAEVDFEVFEDFKEFKEITKCRQKTHKTGESIFLSG